MSSKKAAAAKDSSIGTNGETNVLTPQNKNTTNTKKSLLDDSNKDDSANDEHETDAEDHTEDGETGGRQPRKKLKRGRKLKVLKDNNEVTSPGIIGNNATGVVGTNSLKKKKPRKTTKNVNKKTMNQSMTSDEDEECSASNCSRPPGKKKIIFLTKITHFYPKKIDFHPKITHFHHKKMYFLTKITHFHPKNRIFLRKSHKIYPKNNFRNRS